MASSFWSPNFSIEHLRQRCWSVEYDCSGNAPILNIEVCNTANCYEVWKSDPTLEWFCLLLLS